MGSKRWKGRTVTRLRAIALDMGCGQRAIREAMGSEIVKAFEWGEWFRRYLREARGQQYVMIAQ